MKRNKSILRLLILLLIPMIFCPAAQADINMPYDTYNYNYWNEIVYTPAAYSPKSVISGSSFTYEGKPLGEFKSPQDMCFAPNGDLYVADTGNNRIVVFTPDLKEVKKVFLNYQYNGKNTKFKAPTGVAVSQKGEVYIADTNNRRVAVLDQDGNFIKAVENPKSEVLPDNFSFSPLKVCVDYADRVYCIAKNMFEGIMVFDSNGQFTGFFGTIQVKITVWEKFWRSIATKEERSKQLLYIPTEFTGIDIDDDGFVYASNVDTDGVQAVRRLNPRGQDVIRMGPNGNLGGDLFVNDSGTYGGPSRITNVVYRDNGVYSLLDSKRGRIFTYDHEGNLLYIFGGLGSQMGTFSVPVAIEKKDNLLLVLDSSRNSIQIFGETEYGRLINQAVALRHDGDEAEAVDLWARVLELDENNELANSGIGKAYLSAGDNVKAMEYLKLAMNKDYYSVAWTRHRNELFRQYLGPILTGTLVLIAVLVVVKLVIKRKKGHKEVDGL